MMMEAIRQSIAAEEDRKKKEEKDAAKAAKKEEKARQKEARKTSGSGTFARTNATSSSAAESSSSAAMAPLTMASATAKGKAVDGTEPTSHVTSSEAPLTSSLPLAGLASRPIHPMSLTNSSASSFSESGLDPGVARSSNEPSPSIELGPNSSGVSLDGAQFNSETPPGSAGVDGATGGPVFSFRSLDEVVGDGSKGNPLPGDEPREDMAKAPAEASVREEGNKTEATLWNDRAKLGDWDE